MWTFSIQKYITKGVNNTELKSLDKHFYKSLGQEISRIRHQQGISLKDIAEELSVSKQMIDNFELGKNRLSEDKFTKICKILNIEPNINVNVKFKELEE